MPQVTLPGRELQLEVECHGREGDPVVMLIMGLGMQLLAWPQPYIEALVQAGYRVVCFDNRDAGLSGSGHLQPHTAVPLALLASLIGRRFRAPYTLYDLADDTLALADVLGIRRFHVIGASMGGMIGQIIATRAPDRILSLNSIMSSAGPDTTPRPRAEVLFKVLKRPPAGGSPELIREHFLGLFTILGQLTDPAEIQRLRERLDRTVRRAYKPEGTSRQLLAILANPDRSFEVARIEVPTLILHGRIDPLVRPPAAEHLARLIRGARLHWIEGMGHYLPMQAMPELIELTLGHLRAAR